MYVFLRIEGLNLERLLRTALIEGVRFRRVRRREPKCLEAEVPIWQMRKLRAICDRFGWRISVIRRSWIERGSCFIRRRPALLAGLAACAALMHVSDGMILNISIENARENIGEVRTFLREEGVGRGAWKAALSLDDLRAKMALRLPDLAFAGVRYEGSTMIVDCYPSERGEQGEVSGKGNDIHASKSGIVTRIYVQRGTPAVVPGQAVRKGQVLIRGEERTQKGETVAVRAQGQVAARVWSQGTARVSLTKMQTVETGRTRRRVTVRTPWHQRIVQDDSPFASQDSCKDIQRVVGLYLPLWREIETYAETIVHQIPSSRADAMSWAQQAAEEIAKNGCPYDALILDKWVDYSMIDTEVVYAAVVLEYESQIAARSAAQ